MAFLTLMADTEFADAPHWPCPHPSSCPLGHLPRPADMPHRFGIAHPDRRLHLHILGKTGTGKTTLLKNLIIQDLRHNHGVAVIDPHGNLVNSLLELVPSHRVQQTVYFNPADVEFPLGFNILESVHPDMRPLVASHVVTVYKDIYRDSWGPRLEYILHNAILSLLDIRDSTLLGMLRLLSDKDYRARVVPLIQDPLVKKFWTDEFDRYTPAFQKEAIAPIQNKVGQFLTSYPIRNIVGQVKSSVDMTALMEGQGILLANLAKGQIGEDKTNLLGSLLVTKLFLAAVSRANQPEESRKDFYLYIDECHNLSTPIFATILSEARKYHLNLTLTHQSVHEMSSESQ